MSSKSLSSLVIFAIYSAALSACSSVSDKIPVVKIERKKPQVLQTQDVSYLSPSAIGSGSNLQSAEAALVCENDNMRTRAADDNYKNDSARVLILEDNDNNSSQVVGEAKVNCREYFVNKSAGIVPANYGSNYVSSQPQPQPQYQTPRTISTPRPAVQSQPEPIQTPRKATQSQPQSQSQSGLFYSVSRGDTLYAIAKQHCTSVDAIKRLNNIDNPRTLDVNTILRMPVGNCR
ncbi:MAG: LysM peptidoglycan-binding domain-containing protein [Litorimonas sp.]